MALITCKECGAQISNKSTNCINCGAPISYSLEVNQDNKARYGEITARNEESANIKNAVAENNSKKKFKIIGVAFLSLVILAVIVAMALLSGNNEIQALSNEEILAVGSVQELMARSNDPGSIELKRVEVAKYNSEDNKSDNSVPCDYIVRLTYNANNDSIGLENGDTGELIAFVVIDIGDYIKYSIDQEIQALSLLLFSTNEDPIDVDLDLVNKVLANPSKYNLKIEAVNSESNESKDNSIPKTQTENNANPETSSPNTGTDNEPSSEVKSLMPLGIDFIGKTFSEIESMLGTKLIEATPMYGGGREYYYGSLESDYIRFGFPFDVANDVPQNTKVVFVSVIGNWPVDNQISAGMPIADLEKMAGALDFYYLDEDGCWTASIILNNGFDASIKSFDKSVADVIEIWDK